MMERDILTVQQLSMRFGGIVALNDVSLTVKHGSITALIGPNGAGKTTLFNCLTGFYLASAGQLIFTPGEKAIDIKRLLTGFLGGSHRVIKAGIARTFQNIRLFRDMTVMENLLVGQHLHVNRNPFSGLLNTPNYKQSEQQAVQCAYEWLELFHLTKEGNRLAGELPFGKQRHLEIARAMCTRPSLLCLDEPAAGLNANETQELSDIIVSLRKSHQVSILLIEHDMSLVMRISDHVVVLDHGHVISAGTPAMVQQDKKVIAAYLGEESHQ